MGRLASNRNATVPPTETQVKRSQRRAESQPATMATTQNANKRKIPPTDDSAGDPVLRRSKRGKVRFDGPAQPNVNTATPSKKKTSSKATSHSVQIVMESPRKKRQDSPSDSIAPPLTSTSRSGESEAEVAGTVGLSPNPPSNTMTRDSSPQPSAPQSADLPAPSDTASSSDVLQSVTSILKNVLSSSVSIEQNGTKQQPETAKAKVSVPQPTYNRLTATKRQEITDKVAELHSSLRDFAATNGLNPVDVARYAFGGELKVANLNPWKCFQLLSGMVRNNLVVWDENLSQLIGRNTPPRSQDAPHVDASGSNATPDDESIGDDDSDIDIGDDEAEPAISDDNMALSDSAAFDYHPHDPVGARLGKLSESDGVRYHHMKAACAEAGKLKEWKQDLSSTVLRLSMMLSTKSLTNARAKKAVKKTLEDLQRYAIRMYGLYGLSINGIILGTNLLAPSTVLHPTFFGPEPEVVGTLKSMLTDPQVSQYLTAQSLTLYSNRGQNHDLALAPFIPAASMPPFHTSSASGSGIWHSTTHSQHPSSSTSTSIPPRPRSKTPSARANTPASTNLQRLAAIEDKLLEEFCSVQPFSLEASGILHSIHEGLSKIFKLQPKRQMALLYKVFQYFWIQALEPFHKGKKSTAPRFNIHPVSVASLASESKDYLRCRLVGYPLKTRYPGSASELQQFHTWEAAPYETQSNDGDNSHLEVTDITETLVFNLIEAFLRGSEYDGDSVCMKFQKYKYPRKSKKKLTRRAVIVDVKDKPVVWATGEVLSYEARVAADPIPPYDDEAGEYIDLDDLDDGNADTIDDST